MFENLKSQGLAKPEVSLGHPFSSAGMAQRAKEVDTRKLQGRITKPEVSPGSPFFIRRDGPAGLLRQSVLLLTKALNRRPAIARNPATIPRYRKRP